MGEGTFGRVLRCKYHGKTYAVKVFSIVIQVIKMVARYIESAKT